MSSIVYAGVRNTQVRHAIQCKKCLETIESKHVHDFKYCSCMAVGIDGGISAGNRILGSTSDIEYRRMYCAIIGNKKVWLVGLNQRLEQGLNNVDEDDSDGAEDGSAR